MLAVLATVSFGASTVGAQAGPAKAGFTGRWALDVARSDFGAAAAQAPTSVTMTVSRTADHLLVDQTVVVAGQTMSVRNDYALDGREVAATAGDGQPAMTSARAAGDTLFIDAAMDRQGMRITRASRWTLGADGRTMTIVQTMQTPMGGLTMHAVFDRTP